MKIITKDSIGSLQRPGIGNSLVKAAEEFGLKRPISILELIRLAEESQPEPRFISVSKEGAGTSTVFIVTGEGFTPNSLVVIRITATNFGQLQFPETADRDGKFVSRHSVSCQSGQQLTFTAFEDADPSGTFANAVVTTCP